MNLLDLYPRSKRPIEERGQQITEEHRAVARQFGRDFFDGERLYGYGGYSYHPRFWQDTVQRFRDHYGLREDAAILDVGCAKGFMLYDMAKLMPSSFLAGIDVSRYAIVNSMPEIRGQLQVANGKELSYRSDSFDLVISINSIHNLPLEECKNALREIERVSRGHSFITVDAWRDEREKERMLMWNLTALTYMQTDNWKALFDEVGYTGDYYWFIAE